MTSFWEILKSSKSLKASDAFAELWGKSIADRWDIITITGTLPLTFEAKGEALTNYRLYGTENGAGEKTVQLFNPATVTVGQALADGTYSSNVNYRYSDFIAVEPETTYFLNDMNPSKLNIALQSFDENKNFLKGTQYAIYSNRNNFAFTTEEQTHYIRFTMQVGALDTASFVLGSTAPASYIPYGYQIPLTVTSGEQSDTYPVYIGDTQLMDEEYVDYQEQKIYRTILLTTHDNKDFITSDNKRFCVRRSNNA